MQSMRTKAVDKPLLITVAVLVVAGVLIFSSAALGLLTREGISLGRVVFSQLFLGLFLGIAAIFITYKINYHFWNKWSFWIFVSSLVVTVLVFVPGVGVELGGARRWLDLGPISFQPAEFLKFGFVVYLASWLQAHRDSLNSTRYGVVPLVIILSLVSFVLLSQPSTGAFVVVVGTAGVMFLVAGGRWSYLFIAGVAALLLLVALIYARPYAASRITTFLNPQSDPLGSSYQLRQSLIGIGSGSIFGRGFGQSIQKFGYLPEPVGDSVFAVAAEEFGFFGSLLILVLFTFLALRGFFVAARAPDNLGRFLAVGIVIMIVLQSFINIAAMTGLLPITGLPLLFISHGGTALLFTLAEVGIVLNISKHMREI